MVLIGELRAERESQEIAGPREFRNVLGDLGEPPDRGQGGLHHEMGGAEIDRLGVRLEALPRQSHQEEELPQVVVRPRKVQAGGGLLLAPFDRRGDPIPHLLDRGEISSRLDLVLEEVAERIGVGGIELARAAVQL